MLKVINVNYSSVTLINLSVAPVRPSDDKASVTRSCRLAHSFMTSTCCVSGVVPEQASQMAETGKGRPPGTPLQPLHEFRRSGTTLCSCGPLSAEPFFASRFQSAETVRRYESRRTGRCFPRGWRLPTAATGPRVAGELPQSPPSTTSFPGPSSPRGAAPTSSSQSRPPHIQFSCSCQLVSESPRQHIGGTTPQAAGFEPCRRRLSARCCFAGRSYRHSNGTAWQSGSPLRGPRSSTGSGQKEFEHCGPAAEGKGTRASTGAAAKEWRPDQLRTSADSRAVTCLVPSQLNIVSYLSYVSQINRNNVRGSERNR